jgi:hypothetical protein
LDGEAGRRVTMSLMMFDIGFDDVIAGLQQSHVESLERTIFCFEKRRVKVVDDDRLKLDFVLITQYFVSYYQNEDVEKPSGFLYITDATVKRCSMKDRDFAFEIKSVFLFLMLMCLKFICFTFSTPKRTYFIAAESKQQCDVWVDKLNQLINTVNELKSSGTNQTK